MTVECMSMCVHYATLLDRKSWRLLAILLYVSFALLLVAK